MRIFSFLLAIIYLQGCATSYVWQLARGKETTDLLPMTVQESWIDRQRQEYVICLQVFPAFNTTPSHPIERILFPYHQQHEGLVTLKVPVDILNQENSSVVNAEFKEVYEDLPDQHWWSSDVIRNSIKAYNLTVPVENGCSEKNIAWESMKFMNVAEKESLYFKGKEIDDMLQKYHSFVIYRNTNPDSIDADWKFSPCNQVPCFMQVANLSNDSDSNTVVHEKLRGSIDIYSIDKLLWISESKPLWYLAMPFAVAADATVWGVVISVIAGGSMGGGRWH